MRKMDFRVDESSRDKLRGLDLGYLCFEGVKVCKSEPISDAEVASATLEAQEKFKDSSKIADEPIIKGIRKLFSNAGIDPTKERPSGEALIRRVCDGKNIYRINNVVDSNNAISIRTACPCGAYDLEKIDGDAITIRVGGKGESYLGIAGKTMNAEGKIVSIDGKGIFGGPTADSERTSIGYGANEILMLIYHPDSASTNALEKAMKMATDIMQRSMGCKMIYEGILFIK
ncbi:MAG: phenylalanine--tRNA ligase beta subunit-related protein [Candidatus Micrarchaeota archaeon]